MSSTIHLCSVSSHEFRNLFNLLNMLQPKEKNYAQINEEEGKHHPHILKFTKYYPFPYSIYPSNKTQARQKKVIILILYKCDKLIETIIIMLTIAKVAFTEMQARKTPQ
ncbi:hypothetical protein ACJX0J_022656 [Zea mays]